LGCDALANDGEVRRALKVAAKLAVPKGRQKLPLNCRDLRRVVHALADRGRFDFQGVRDRALFLLGWVGIFRSSELVGVTWCDVCFAKEGGALIYVLRSKTDQAGQGAWVFIAACPEEPLMCLVAALRVLRSVMTGSGAAAEGPVFVGQAGHPVGLAKTTVAMRLRKALQALGVQEWELYVAHSLRRGGATWAVRQGVSWRRVQSWAVGSLTWFGSTCIRV
jgi:integrase